MAHHPQWTLGLGLHLHANTRNPLINLLFDKFREAPGHKSMLQVSQGESELSERLPTSLFVRFEALQSDRGHFEALFRWGVDFKVLQKWHEAFQLF